MHRIKSAATLAVVASLAGPAALPVVSSARIPSGPRACLRVIAAVRQVPGFQRTHVADRCILSRVVSSSSSRWTVVRKRHGAERGYVGTVVINDSTCTLGTQRFACFKARVLTWRSV